GSLLALATYPVFFENHFTRKAQATIWGWGLGAFACCCGYCAVKLLKAERQGLNKETRALDSTGGIKPNPVGGEQRPAGEAAGPTVFTRLLWVILPACASALLLATTNKLCQDIAVIPFLWVLPLGLYLLSFAICFDSPRWYMRLPFGLAFLGAL